MMLPSCMDWDIHVRILDRENAIAFRFCEDKVIGSFQDKQDVIDAFCDFEVVTADLEAVSVAGLKALEDKGVLCAPSSQVLSVIQNKYLQKKFFKDSDIPTSDFKLLSELKSDTPHGFLKVPTGGYDGKGVSSWKGDLSQIPEEFKKNVLWEEGVAIDKEISVIVARGYSGETQCYLPTEMGFDPKLNLIAYTFYPARIDQVMSTKAMELAAEIAQGLEMVGVMAVEMFIDTDGKLLVNELAPRPHNSGHHTIESTYTSQFENHIRAVVGLPLGSVERVNENKFSLTFNVIGESDGEAQWLGVGELLSEKEAYLHNYGKIDCRAGRKMGHITLLGNSESDLIKRYEYWSEKIRVIGV